MLAFTLPFASPQECTAQEAAAEVELRLTISVTAASINVSFAGLA